MGGVAGRQDNDRENDELVFVVFIPAPLDEPIPGAHLVQSRPDIRLRVGTGVLRTEFRPGQRGQARLHARSDVLRVVAAFEREYDFPFAVLICQSNQMI